MTCLSNLFNLPCALIDIISRENSSLFFGIEFPIVGTIFRIQMVVIPWSKIKHQGPDLPPGHINTHPGGSLHVISPNLMVIGRIDVSGCSSAKTDSWVSCALRSRTDRSDDKKIRKGRIGNRRHHHFRRRRFVLRRSSLRLRWSVWHHYFGAE